MTLSELAQAIHANAVAKGFWDRPRNLGEAIALIHAEASELLEAVRVPEGPHPSEHCPAISAEEEEAADIVIRVLDLCEGLGWRIEEAVRTKMAYNASRPHKHCKSF